MGPWSRIGGSTLLGFRHDLQLLTQNCHRIITLGTSPKSIYTYVEELSFEPQPKKNRTLYDFGIPYGQLNCVHW